MLILLVLPKNENVSVEGFARGFTCRRESPQPRNFRLCLLYPLRRAGDNRAPFPPLSLCGSSLGVSSVLCNHKYKPDPHLLGNSILIQKLDLPSPCWRRIGTSLSMDVGPSKKQETP
ncbi:unnamed protein product [Microthlaspi erraticum]|uniref:Uncharacterized protein n=1 Tax=Microthlaspi erraticum TaxID=1685480 RepID=A0A6D2ITB9_9BRAS|nr:unnamed protein product [Microthlaspi erraticum]